MSKRKTLSPKAMELLKATGSVDNLNVAYEALYHFVKAQQDVMNDAILQRSDNKDTAQVRDGVLDGDTVGDIFTPVPLQPGATATFPLDVLVPGTENEHVAIAIPRHGYIPQRLLEGDEVDVPVFQIGSAVDWNVKYSREYRWDVVSRRFEILRGGFVHKSNNDGWFTIIATGVARNLVVFDSDAPTGFLTKRLFSLMQLFMARNGGGNSTSLNRRKLTDVYISPERMEDIRNWNVDQIDEVTRREIHVTEGENAINRLFGVNVHVLYELGVGHEYQTLYEDVLGGTLPTGKNEIVVGLDLSRSDVFVRPIKGELELHPDTTNMRSGLVGAFGWLHQGWAVLDSRHVLIGAV